jgi:sigma-B regulation protein RsbU (phosphoserine phosphatase)
MTQRTLYKLVEKIGQQQYDDEEHMLIAVLERIVDNERTSFEGGRIWKLDEGTGEYVLIHESGNIESVGVGFRISLKGYAVFGEVAKHRTVIADETNSALRRKGIIKYSATGIGDRVSIGKIQYYEYLMAFNTQTRDRELRYMLSIAGQAASQLLRNRRTEEARRNLLSDMELARDLQRRLLPEHEFRFGRYEVYGVSIPEKTVGGDFFHYYQIPDEKERFGISVGDAASKGFAAAVQALFVSGALMMSVEEESKISSMFRRINTINRKIFPESRFVTLFYCEVFDTENGLILYTNAGHCKPVHYRAARRECEELDVTGPIIGLLEDANFGLSATALAKDDLLVLYTDGITEANDGEDEYQESRLMNVISANAKKPARDICLHILDDVQQFSAHGLYADDKTVVVMKRVS